MLPAGVRLEEERQAHWLVHVERPPPPRKAAMGGGARAGRDPQPARRGWGMGLNSSTRAAELVASRQGPEEGQRELGPREPKRSCRLTEAQVLLCDFQPIT